MIDPNVSRTLFEMQAYLLKIGTEPDIIKKEISNIQYILENNIDIDHLAKTGEMKRRGENNG